MKTETKTPKLQIDFSREGKKYEAIISVTAEPKGHSYVMHGEIYTEKGKLVFKKDRTGLDYSQVEPSMIFMFHEAFVE